MLTNCILHVQATKPESFSRENEDLQTEDKGRVDRGNTRKRQATPATEMSVTGGITTLAAPAAI